MNRHAYTVSPAQVIAALAVLIERQRGEIQGQIDDLQRRHTERQAADQARYREEVAREQKRKAAWDAQPYHYGHEWRPEKVYEPPATTYAAPRSLIDKRDAPASHFWVEYDLYLFSGGRDLTDSQKQIWRKTIRETAEAGLIERDGRRWLRLTEAGASLLELRRAAIHRWRELRELAKALD